MPIVIKMHSSFYRLNEKKKTFRYPVHLIQNLISCLRDGKGPFNSSERRTITDRYENKGFPAGDRRVSMATKRFKSNSRPFKIAFRGKEEKKSSTV